jgi:aerobic carbon-monoxide dehydrogenase small subunit
MKHDIKLRVNGDLYNLQVESRRTLLEVLREQLGLTGTKEMCNKGDCGGCTVILDGRAVLSCTVLAVEADGSEVLTIEGLAGKGYELHSLQKAFVDHGAIQCGYCTPGFIMSAAALLARNPNPTRDEIREAISNHICRCTGYVHIIEAIEAAAKDMEVVK